MDYSKNRFFIFSQKVFFQKLFGSNLKFDADYTEVLPVSAKKEPAKSDTSICIINHKTVCSPILAYFCNYDYRLSNLFCKPKTATKGNE
jgi:hypothetical protein